MKRKYEFDDFQLDGTGDGKIDMESGISIPIRNIADLPSDIAEIVNNSVSKTMDKFEISHGKVNNLSALRLVAWLQLDENNPYKHYIGLILFDDVGLVNDARTDIYIQPESESYSSFAGYCMKSIAQHLFAT